MITQLPGFANPVHDAQRTFRALLDALARPGLIQTTAHVAPPDGLAPSCAAAALTLLDLETTVWLQPSFSEDARAWLLFHTGCRFTIDPQTADFALIQDLATAPSLFAFSHGTAEYPEASTSLLIQLPDLENGEAVMLQGPGIKDSICITLPLTVNYWQQWQAMTEGYPLGLDAWYFAGDRVLGLPRTARVQGSEFKVQSFQS
ncbi:MAG: phosphonate C-P lyase system protein PhnH [Spirulina sp. SIO3F2]|nr:phosphonate C-P lyase system protein PhnH [Spirulina sp. SIO3F2]